MTFEEWYGECDEQCVQIAGVGIDDLPDGCSRDAYDDNVTPLEYVQERLEDAGFPMDLM